MKKCPFYAEEIQDAAIVCKHCGRDLPAAPANGAAVQSPAAPKAKRHSLALIIGGLVLLWIVVALVFAPESIGSRPPGGAATEERLLNASATKGLLSFSLTNRESKPIRDCRLYVQDAEGVQWAVMDSRVIAPLETASFDGDRFVAKGQPMPGNIGRSRGVYVSCLVTGIDKHLTAAFR